MCLFSGAVTDVSATNIFARHVGAGRQALVYSMTLAADQPVAMCLPLPIVPGSFVQFIDLSGYPTFFDDCEAAFPEPSENDAGMLGMSDFSETLAVHAVGDFIASFVPTIADFDRLDLRFRLPAGALAAHAEYADWGFAVFQLANARVMKRRWFWQRGPGVAVPSAFHPMALTFETRHERALFFPTLHLHDGATVPREADYDHTLYCQPGDPVLARTFAWRPSPEPLGASVEVASTAGIIDGKAAGYRRTLRGRSTNIDHLIAPPACRLESLAARRELFAFELAATAAYYTELGTVQSRAWHATATTRLDDLHDGMVAGLTTLCAAQRDTWKLVPLPADDAPMAPQLVTISQGPVRRTASGSYLETIGTSTDLVERQNVRFAFAEAPDRRTISAIEVALAEVFDRAVA